MNGCLQVNISPAAAVLLLYLFHKNYGDKKKKKMALSRYNLHIKQNLVVAPGPRSLSGPCGRTFPKGGAWPESSPALLRAWPSLSPSRAVLSLHCMWVWPALPCCPRARLRVRPDFGEGPCLPSCCGLSLPHAQGGAGPGVPAGRPGPLPLCPPTASASLPPSRSCLAALHRRGPGDLLGPWVHRAAWTEGRGAGRALRGSEPPAGQRGWRDRVGRPGGRSRTWFLRVFPRLSAQRPRCRRFGPRTPTKS